MLYTQLDWIGTGMNCMPRKWFNTFLTSVLYAWNANITFNFNRTICDSFMTFVLLYDAELTSKYKSTYTMQSRSCSFFQAFTTPLQSTHLVSVTARSNCPDDILLPLRRKWSQFLAFSSKYDARLLPEFDLNLILCKRNQMSYIANQELVHENLKGQMTVHPESTAILSTKCGDSPFASIYLGHSWLRPHQISPTDWFKNVVAYNI